MQSPTIICLAAALLGAASGSAAQDVDLQASYDFLVREQSAGGALVGISNPTGRYLIPVSYRDSAAYWGVAVCGRAAATCAVTDTYNPLTYELSPAPGPAGKLQVERVNTHTGANIYDAATWQIAVMLGYVRNKLRLASPTSAYALASGLGEVLTPGDGAPGAGDAPGTRRAVTDGATFVYNGSVVAAPRRAYAFRALAPAWLAPDPLAGSPFAAFIAADRLPPGNPAYEVGRISWSDWKPITGENAWAFLIGPLQAAYIQFIELQDQQFVPFTEPAIQNALDLLPTFAAMQSGVGAVYYAPAGTVANDGEAAVDPYDVSVENNLSLYAGLRLLRATLRATAAGDAALRGQDRARVSAALDLAAAMLDGGVLDGGRRTQGLASFLRNRAWRDGLFVQGGLASASGRDGGWVPRLTPRAVDVQTWGIAALGARQFDQWFGEGASYALWQRVKTWGGYGVGRELWGVGYSDQDGNGIGPDGAYRQGVLSGEWTAGAITAVRNMIAAYEAVPASSPRAAAARAYVASLRQDEAAMLKGLAALRIDRYAAADMPGKPADYAQLVQLSTKPHLYASRRYRIPFGWFANPLPSTASTAWAVMLANRYDPFGYGGQPN